MKTLALGVVGVLALLLAPVPEGALPWRAELPEAPPDLLATPVPHPTAEPPPAPEDLTAVVQRYCQICHNDAMRTGNLTLQGFDVANPVPNAETAEKMIQKLRMGMMPPPGVPRPGGDTLMALVQTLEQTLDRAAAAAPNPGSRSFQRLNRVEYESSIRELLGLEVNAGDFLPLDTKSANFDNIADAQLLSPTLLDAYLRGAMAISRMAIGYPDATPGETTYRIPRRASQVDRVEGAPFGTRGGTSVMHSFPADGEYSFRFSFPTSETGTAYGNGRSALHTDAGPEQIEVSVDGEPVLVVDVDRWMHVSDPNGAEIRTKPVFIRSGPRRLTAAFIKRYEGPLADLVSPHAWSQTSSGGVTYGAQLVPHIREFVVAGPYNPRGVSETPVRRRIFSCRPSTAAEAAPCAEQIVSRLAAEAFRRPVTPEERDALLSFYQQGAGEGGFEVGVRTALEAILASPHFVFRFERRPENAGSNGVDPLDEFALASRLSYFLWATPPDQQLLDLARQGKLSDRRVLRGQAERMLADRRSEALATRFLAQWLRLPDLDAMEPDTYLYPDYHQQLGEAMKRETELFFYDLVRSDKSALELFTADYTFVNERLAKHYGISGVRGEEFTRVQYPDATRRGLLGHASVLTLTSVPARTSPVLRGKWVMEVILGTPPPPPPPGIPALEDTKGAADDGRLLTTRERMEIHRANPTCNACHRFMDPIGLALDNFDAVGRWRIRENGSPLDTRGQLWDGSPVTSPKELQDALLKRPAPLLRNFTRNLMAYALGRRVEYYDMPTVRRIVQGAEAADYRMSSLILGIVDSDAFRMRRGAGATDSDQR
jgi:hypothetical protein